MSIDVNAKDLIENFCVPVEKTIVILNPVDIDAIKTLAKKGKAKVIPPRGTSRLDLFLWVICGHKNELIGCSKHSQ